MIAALSKNTGNLATMASPIQKKMPRFSAIYGVLKSNMKHISKHTIHRKTLIFTQIMLRDFTSMHRCKKS